MAGVIALDGEPRARSTDGTHRSNYLLSHLDVLEAESVHIMREVAAESGRPLRARLFFTHHFARDEFSKAYDVSPDN